MKIKANSKYFMKISEFIEMNKSPFIAGVLSLCLGIFGIHRFYLGKKLSGFILLALSVTSLEFGNGSVAVILVLVSFIEAIVYFVEGLILLRQKYLKRKISVHNKNNKNDIVKEKQNAEGKQIEKIYKSKESDHMKIIDVSNLGTIAIAKKDGSSNIRKTDWVKKLDFPFESSRSDTAQIREEAIKIYEKLCDYIDDELRSKGTSLAREIRRVEKEDMYFDDLLYALYGIAEGHVSKAYSGRHGHYNSEYLYQTLEYHLGLRTKIYNVAEKLAESISSPNEKTMRFFNLTKNGLPVEWWDEDGSFRESRGFTKGELNILKATPSRATKVWHIDLVKEHIINLYLKIWREISDKLQEDIKWKKKSKTTLSKIIDGRYIYYVDYENGKPLASLLKISENSIREIMPSTSTLNIDNEVNIISRYFPKELVNEINQVFAQYKKDIDNKELKSILDSMIENDPYDWKLKVHEVLMVEDEKQANTVIKYKDDINYTKIAKEIIKKSENDDLLLLCLYGIGKEEKLSAKNLKLLKGMIHPGNITIYEEILDSKEELSIGLLEKIAELKESIRKKIQLDMNKIEESKEELNKTVEILREYIGDEESDEIEMDSQVEIADHEYLDKEELKYKDFINTILLKGFIKVEEGKKVAMSNGTLLNAFISDVNRELYEYVEDQVVIIEDEHIKIDDCYLDMIKELVASEA